MSKLKATTGATLLAAALGVVTPAAAQDFQVQPVFDMGMLANTMTQGAATQQAARLGGQRATAVPASPGTVAVTGLAPIFERGVATPVDAAPARLDYTPTPALRREAVAGLVSRTRQVNPEAADYAQRHFAKHDYTVIYRSLISGSPLRENDAADAVTGYTVLAWQIANRDIRDIPDNQIVAARNQIAPALAANPQINTPSARAALGEEMKLLLVTIQAGWRGANEKQAVAQYSDGVARMWKNQTGRDLRAIKLTDAGFSRR